MLPFPKPKTTLGKCIRWIALCNRPQDQLNINKITKDTCTYICTKVRSINTKITNITNREENVNENALYLDPIIYSAVYSVLSRGNVYLSPRGKFKKNYGVVMKCLLKTSFLLLDSISSILKGQQLSIQTSVVLIRVLSRRQGIFQPANCLLEFLPVLVCPKPGIFTIST